MSFSQTATHTTKAPVEACLPICAILSMKSQKYPPQGIQGLNRGFRREIFSNFDAPFNAQKLRRIKQRKGLCFIQASSDDEDDQDDGKMFLTSPISLWIIIL